MLKALLKKQFLEVFRRYFYDKTGKKHSKFATILLFVLFGVLIVGVLGGMFTVLSIYICDRFKDVNLIWLYYALMGLIAVLFGCFGSVFNTYATLYLAKDNDFLLSMPIPVKTIMASRLLSVFLLGLMYSGVVTIPAAVVSLVMNGASVLSVSGGILFVVFTAFIVLTLSCLLGWVVSLIAVRLKNKSFITVIVSLVFIALYYLVYFKAQDIIGYIVSNSETLGQNVKTYALPFYVFGKGCTGDLLCLLATAAVVFGFFALTWAVMARGFLKIVTSSSSVAKNGRKAKSEKQKTPFFALYRKELKRFTSSATYMLNSGFGILFYVVFAVALFASRPMLEEIIMSLGGMSHIVCAVVVMAICFLSSTITYIVPSVSLEGKSIWILQSMPVNSFLPLKAKVAVHITLSLPLALIVYACSAFVLPYDVAAFAFGTLFIILFNVFNAFFGLFLAVKMCNLDWMNESVPIKQGLNVGLFMLEGVVLTGVFAAIYCLLSSFVGSWVLFGLFALVLFLSSLPLYFWAKGKGSRMFSEL